MKIDLTAADIQHVAGNSLRKKAEAEKYLRKHKSKITAAIIEAAREVIGDWVFEHEVSEPQVTDDEDDYEED
jgi:hypothetical protein